MRPFPLILALFSVAAAAAPPTSLTLVASPQPMTTVRIKDATLNVRVALGFERALLLNLEPAIAAKLKAFPLLGKQTVKNSMIPGGEAVLRGNLYGVAAAGLASLNTPTIWIDKAVTADAAGIVSVMALAADHVTIMQPAAPAGGAVYILPTTGKGDVGAELRLGDDKINVRLALDAPRTVMNATAAQALLDAGLVKRDGSVGLWHPFPQVGLPFEGLQPLPDARILGLPLLAPTARITEARARELDARAKAGTSTAEDQEDAIVVTASKRKGSNRPWVLIGQDVLGKCSKIELDKPGQRWLLTCDFGVTKAG